MRYRCLHSILDVSDCDVYGSRNAGRNQIGLVESRVVYSVSEDRAGHQPLGTDFWYLEIRNDQANVIMAMTRLFMHVVVGKWKWENRVVELACII